MREYAGRRPRGDHLLHRGARGLRGGGPRLRRLRRPAVATPLVVTDYPDVEALARAVTRLERHVRDRARDDRLAPAPVVTRARDRPVRARPGRLRQDQPGGARAGADPTLAGGRRDRRALGGARRRGRRRIASPGAPAALRCSTDLPGPCATTRPDVASWSRPRPGSRDVLPVLAASRRRPACRSSARPRTSPSSVRAIPTRPSRIIELGRNDTGSRSSRPARTRASSWTSGR